MHEYVEIGKGREARAAYDLHALSLVPARRTRSSKVVDTTWHIDAYGFDVPLVSHPTDALASPEFVIEMGKQGGLGVLNAEGLLGRHASFSDAIKRVIGAASIEWDDLESLLKSQSSGTAILQELHQAPLDMDLFAEHMARVRDSGATVAVRVSPQNARELAPQLVKAGAELLFIQGTIISAEHVQQGGEPLNLKEFIGSLDVPVIAGGVFDYSTAMHLMRSGAAGVIVGSGQSNQSMSLDVPLATAIADVAAARRDYLDETGGRYVHVIANAPVDTSGLIAVALGVGADAVMLGEPLARASKASGEGVYWESAIAHPRFPRGEMRQVVPAEQRESLQTVLHGPSHDPYGTMNLVGGLRRIMAKCGYEDAKSFQKVSLTVRK